MMLVSHEMKYSREQSLQICTLRLVIKSFYPQKQAMLVRQLEDEVVKAKTHASQTNPEVKAHLEALQVENDHLSREIAILRETVKVKLFHSNPKCVQFKRTITSGTQQLSWREKQTA